MKKVTSKFYKKVNKKKLSFELMNNSAQTSLMQALEPRYMYDAALAIEVAAVMNAGATAADTDLAHAANNDSNSSLNHAVDALVNEHTGVDQTITQPNALTSDSTTAAQKTEYVYTDSASNTSNPETTLEHAASNELGMTSLVGDYLSHDKSLVKEIIFVDGDVTNYAELLEGVDLNKLIAGELEIKILDHNSSGVDQITNYLAQYNQQIEAIHVVSHGNSGELKLGTDIVNNASLENYKGDLSQWNNSFVNGADILFYGCNVAEGQIGEQFVVDLHEIIKADIAASSNLTGNSDMGGDWNFEVTQGVISASLAFNTHVQQTYQDVLATYYVTNLNTSGAGSLAQAILDANANPGHDTIVFTVAGTIPGGLLYTITSPVTIDGTTAPGYIAPTDPLDPGTPANGNEVGQTGGIYGSSVNASHITIMVNGVFHFNAGSAGSVMQGMGVTNPSASSASGAIRIQTTNVTIQNNYITNVSATGSIASVYATAAGGGAYIYNNLIQNGFFAVDVRSANSIIEHNTLINHSSAGIYISNNAQVLYNDVGNSGVYAIRVESSAASLIKGNDIHHSSSGAAVMIGSNRTTVIEENIIRNNSRGITVATGDNVSIYNNKIYNNTNMGIAVHAGASSYRISGNSIYSNGGSGIDVYPSSLDGFTPNDINDTDNVQNFPTITGVEYVDGILRITGYLNSAASQNYRLEFFADNSATDPEAKYYLGSMNVTTDNTLPTYDANFVFEVAIDAYTDLPRNIFETKLTATASNIATGKTSEISPATSYTLPNPLVVTNVNSSGVGSLSYAIEYANNNPGSDVITFNLDAADDAADGVLDGKFTIILPDSLYTITGALTIDGTTALGYSEWSPTVNI